MIWSPPTLQDALNNNETFIFNTKQPTPDPAKLKYQCQCEAFVWPFQLIDCRNLLHVTPDFACDGCWTTWQRNSVDIDGLGEIIVPLTVDPKKHARYKKPIWNKRWIAALGAPQEVLDMYP